MKFRTGLVVGFAVGYVLGARAGRQRYDQMVAFGTDLIGEERLEDLTAKGKEMFGDSTEKARSVVGQGLTATSRKLRDVAEDDGEAGTAASG